MQTQISLAPADVPVRIAARVIDFLVVGGIDVLLGKWIGFGFNWLFIAVSIVILYFSFMDAYAGWTLGKFALGLRVLGPAGGTPTVRQAFAREAFTLLGAVPFAGPFLALGAWVWIWVTIRSSALRQGKHDMLAGGTRVVRRIKA